MIKKYQKIIKLLDNKLNQPKFKFRNNNWTEVNHGSWNVQHW